MHKSWSFGYSKTNLLHLLSKLPSHNNNYPSWLCINRVSTKREEGKQKTKLHALQSPPVATGISSSIAFTALRNWSFEDWGNGTIISCNLWALHAYHVQYEGIKGGFGCPEIPWFLIRDPRISGTSKLCRIRSLCSTGTPLRPSGWLGELKFKTPIFHRLLTLQVLMPKNLSVLL